MTVDRYGLTVIVFGTGNFPCQSHSLLYFDQMTQIWQVKSVPSTLTEIRHNRIVQSPHENYFNVCRQLKEK